MKRRQVLAGLGLASVSRFAGAQPAGFPSKPIRIVVPFAGGSGSDTGARVYGEMLSKLVGQPVLVENRPGASGQIAIQAVRQAPASVHPAGPAAGPAVRAGRPCSCGRPVRAGDRRVGVARRNAA